jgi:hypothetical protein
MTWELFFHGCFAFGFVLSLLAFVGRSTHLHLHHACISTTASSMLTRGRGSSTSALSPAS